VAGQWHFDPDSYLAMVRAEIPAYDELHDRLAGAIADMQVATILDLGSGTGSPPCTPWPVIRMPH